MNTKQRILERTIASLDPQKDGEIIARLKTELETMIDPVPAPDFSQKPAVIEGEKQLTQKDVDNYRSLGIKEVHLHSNRLKRDIFIVLEKTGQGRIEFLPEEILKLTQTKDMFDGVIVDVSRRDNANLTKSNEGGEK